MPGIFKDRSGELDLAGRGRFLAHVARKVRPWIVSRVETLGSDLCKIAKGSVRTRQGNTIGRPDRLKGTLAVKFLDGLLLRFTVNKLREATRDELFQF